MKKIIFLAFLSASFMSAQNLTTTSGTVTIKSGASMNVNGLGLNPTADHVIGNNNSITMSTTPIIANNGNESMARVYNFASPSADFLGTIVYAYEDADQNSIAHADAVLEVNEAGQWQNYADSDGVDNTVTHEFTSAIQISSVTASSSAATLTVESISDNQMFKVYPNPVVSKINIAHNDTIEATIFNQLGQRVMQVDTESMIENTININDLKSGIYFMKILAGNQEKTMKFIKE